MTDARRRELFDLIRSGPVFQVAELTIQPEDFLSDIESPACVTDINTSCLDDWLQLGAILEEALGEQYTDVRVYEYYLPIYFWILRELNIHLDNERRGQVKHRPFILGFCCPQGGGKTTMTTFMQTLLLAMGKSCQIASLDDFYVPHAEQQVIAEKYEGNRLMQFRGMPGTHDIDFLVNTLDGIRGANPVSIPKYDKSAFSGRGDRAPKDKWVHLSDETDVLLLEGWCLGFEPVNLDEIADNNLNVVNDALHDFGKIYTRLDGLFLIEIANMDWVYDWRLQAERTATAAGKKGLTDEQVIDFVDRFMPAYKQYSQQLYRRKTPLVPRHELHIEIDEERRPIHRSHSRN